MKLHNSNIGVFIIIIITIITFGHCTDVTISFGCYIIGAATNLTANYSGGSTFNRVEWYYSGKLSTPNLIVALTSPCYMENAPAGYPNISDMVVTCQTNTYQLTIKNSTSSYFDGKYWGVRFRLSSDASFTDLVKGTVPACGNSACSNQIAMCLLMVQITATTLLKLLI